MEDLKVFFRKQQHLLAGLFFIAFMVLAFYIHNKHYNQALSEDLEKALTAAESGNMKVVRKILVRYPGREEFIQCRQKCFEVIRDDYDHLNPHCKDKQYNSILNRRIRTEGICVKDVETMNDGKLWCCIQIPTSNGEGRYIQLFFEKKEYTLEELQLKGLVQGARIRVYGFFDRIDKKLFKKDELGIRPVEMIEVIP